MIQHNLDKAICAITQKVLNKLDTEEIIRETMIEYGVHPFSDDVTDTQVHVAFNEIYQEVINYQIFRLLD
jgi:hypothetical protein